MKKSLALVASLLMGVSAVSIPVNAESDISGKFIVTAIKDNRYLMTQYIKTDKRIISELLTCKVGNTDFSVGDVLVPNSQYMILESYPGDIQFYGQDAGFEKVDTCDEVTLTAAQNHAFSALESAGLSDYYRSEQENAFLGEEYVNFNPEEGETVTFYVYDGILVLPKLNSTDAETVLSVGDADGNGKADILDVITVHKAILGKGSLSDAQLKAVDFNGDGKPDAEDALTLMKKIVGLI